MEAKTRQETIRSLRAVISKLRDSDYVSASEEHAIQAIHRAIDFLQQPKEAA